MNKDIIDVERPVRNPEFACWNVRCHNQRDSFNRTFFRVEDAWAFYVANRQKVLQPAAEHVR